MIKEQVETHQIAFAIARQLDITQGCVSKVLHWPHVIFSDEARFLLNRVDGRLRVRRRKEEGYHESYILQKVHSVGGVYTVRGAFLDTGKTELVFLERNLTQVGDVKILREKLLPFARAAFGANFLYQDDSAPTHRGQHVVNFLEEEEVERLPWPAYTLPT